MRYASKVAMCRVQIPKLAYDNNTLEFWYTGNGSATFDPAITTSKSTTIVWQTSDGQNVTTTGTSHAFSYTPASGGPYRCTVRVNGGLGLVAALTCDADSIVFISPHVFNHTFSGSIVVNNNTDLSLPLYILRTQSQIWIQYTSIYGQLSDLSPGYNTFGCPYSTKISGSLSNLASSVQSAWLYACMLIVPGSIAHLTAIRDIRIYSIGWLQGNISTPTSGVDGVIASAWGARASYTYSSPSMQIGGTNAAPSGNYIAPEEGADWHEDSPGHWVPLTGKAMIYDLVNDVNGEGFNAWTITYTT